MSRGPLIKQYLLSTVFFIFISIFTCTPVISEEATHSTAETTASQSTAGESTESDTEETDRSADLLDLLYRFINFTILVTILVILIKKARLMDYLSTRSEEIRNKLEELKRQKEEAEKKYIDMEGKVRDFESRRKDLLEEYRKEGIAERDRIIADAQDRIKQIIAQAEASIEQEIRSARSRLKQDIAELAIAQAKEIIQKEITEKDHDGLINEFIEKVRKTN